MIFGVYRYTFILFTIHVRCQRKGHSWKCRVYCPAYDQFPMGCHYFKHIPCFRRIMGTDQRSVTLKSPFWTYFRVTLATLFLKRHGYRKGVCCICPNVLSYFMKKLYVFLFCRETALDLKQIWYKYTDREISHGSCFSVKAFRL